jgi:N-acetyl-gamma-glutamyl-phosphate reductase
MHPKVAIPAGTPEDARLMSGSMVTKVAVVGASGYSGKELLRLLLMHPGIELSCITSRQQAGVPLGEVFPRFRHSRSESLCFVEPDAQAIATTGAEAAFLALPHGVAAEMALPLLDLGLRVIDLSADFRLRDVAVYNEFYHGPHPAPEWLPKAVYGLPESRREEIRTAQLVAAPGCYPTSILTPLLPLLREGLIESDGIVAASMSGTSGAGKKASEELLFAECNESVRAYGAPKHRHLSEIEQELGIAAGRPVILTFIPHLVPVTAGICTSISAAARPGITLESLTAAYARAYGDAVFVRRLGPGKFADTKSVTGTNFVDIGWHLDARAGRVLLSSAEDNLGKGAAGQAVQCFNLMFGHAESAGLMNF